MWSPDHTIPEAHTAAGFFSYLSHYIPLLFKLTEPDFLLHEAEIILIGTEG